MGVSLGVEVVELAERVAASTSVAAVGARTQWEVAGTPDANAVAVVAPGGVVAYDPRDLTVTVGAGISVRELGAVLGEHAQECPLDPRDDAATVGGVLATGLSGLRRLRYGPVRDRVLEVRFVTADGRVVKGGGPTVKNVTGFDLPRLLVGSFGTIGVLVQVTLRCQPRAARAEWCTTALDPFAVTSTAYRPSCVAWDGRTTHVLLEGVDGDVEAEADALGADSRAVAAPSLPTGPHRGRISVRPGRLATLATALDASGARWLSEIGVGTVHVATDTEGSLAVARAAAEAEGGWLLREAGAPGLPAFGRGAPNGALQRRIRDAFDPTTKLGRGRLDEVFGAVALPSHDELPRREVQREGRGA